MEQRAYPSDVSDEEWALVAPYVTLMTEAAEPVWRFGPHPARRVG